MRLSALEIKKQDFKKVMRGYEQTEVRAFMELISSQWEDLVQDNRELSTKVTELETSLKDYKQVEKVLHQTMLQAEETSKNMAENARNQAINIVKEAEIKGMGIIEAAKQDVAELKQQIQLLQSQRMEITNKLRVFLDNMDRNLKDFEHDHHAPKSYEIAEKEAVKTVKSEIKFDEKPVRQAGNDNFFQPVGMRKPEPSVSQQTKINLDDILNKLD